MDADLVIAWVEALESGTYPQTQRCLRDRRGYCCLGVLADVAMQRGVVAGRWEEGGTAGTMTLAIEGDEYERLNVAAGLPAYGPPGRAGYNGFVAIPAALGKLAGIDGNGFRWDAFKNVGDPDHEWSGSTHTTLSGLNDGGHDFRDIARAIKRDVLGIVDEPDSVSAG